MGKHTKFILIRPVEKDDIDRIVDLSKNKRLSYEKAQPQFWKYAGPQAEILQAQWFQEIINDRHYIALVALNGNEFLGFIIGNLIKAPGVYNPGGLMLYVDDFCVKEDSLWITVGCRLINEIKVIAKAKKAVQISVVCGSHDKLKQSFLDSMYLTTSSEWYVGGCRVLNVLWCCLKCCSLKMVY